MFLCIIMFVIQKIINHTFMKYTSCFATYKMGTVKKINIKNRTYYFYNDIIYLNDFDAMLLKIDKKSYKNIGIYNIGYITIKKIDGCESVYSVNPLYLRLDHVNGYIEEKWVNEYLVFNSADKNKELLKKYNDAFNGVSDKIKEVSSDECDYEKYYIKIKFNSDDNLPLNKQLKFHNMTITIRSAFEEDAKLCMNYVYMSKRQYLQIDIKKC